MSVPPEKSIAELRESKELSRQLDSHRNAMFVLTQKDRPIPRYFYPAPDILDLSQVRTSFDFETAFSR